MITQQHLFDIDEPSLTLPETPLARFVYWVKEREQIRVSKESGQPRPWTSDPILATYRFTNIRRKDDRVSRWILRHIIEPYREHPNLWLMLAIARWVNWPPTLQELITEGAWPIGEPNWLRMAAMVDARMARDEKAWTGAYMIRGDNDPSSPYYQGAKGEVVFCRYLGNAVWANRTQVQAALQTRRQQDVHRLLKSLYGWESFMAGQVVADYTWTPLLHEATDLYTWAPLGPGSLRGLNRLLGHPLTASLSPTVAIREMVRLREMVISELGPSYADLTLMDIQSCCCEVDKFLRVVNGEGRTRARYKPETAYE